MSTSVKPKTITLVAGLGTLGVPVPYAVLKRYSELLKKMCTELGSARSWCRGDPRVLSEVVRVLKKLGYRVTMCRETPAGLECEESPD